MNTDHSLEKTATAAQVASSAGNAAGLINFIIRRWWMFLIVGVAAGLFGMWSASRQIIQYQSRLTFAVENGGGEGGLLNLASQFGITVDDGKDIFAGDNILEIMRSRRMVETVLLSVDSFASKPYTMIEYYLSFPGNRTPRMDNVHFTVNKDKTAFSYLEDSVLYAVYLKFATQFIIAQRPDKKLSLFELNVTGPDEKFTKDFTDRLINETNNFYVDISSKKAKRTLDVLETRVATMKGNVGASISSRAATQDANLNPAFEASQVPVLKQQFNIQAYSGAYAEMFKNLELARFQYLKQIPLMQIIDSADYPMKKIKASKLITGIKFAIIAGLLFGLLIWLIYVVRSNWKRPRTISTAIAATD